MVGRTFASIPNEPSTPQWFNRFLLRLSDFYQDRQPSAPVETYRCLSTAAPDPKATPYAMVLFTDIPTLAFSNGTTWLRADGSAV